MSENAKYWNPVIETLPKERLRVLQLKKFKRIFQWAYDHSKFHRDLYEKAGIAPHDIRSIDDIRSVPKVELTPIAREQRENIEKELIDQLRLKTNLRYNLESYDYETLPRYEVKAKRFKDLRKGY